MGHSHVLISWMLSWGIYHLKNKVILGLDLVVV